MSTDRDWEAWGRNDPYYGVLSSEQFRKDGLSPERREAFFASGEEHVKAVFAAIRSAFDPTFEPRRTLDFGCGVGRLLIPLASRCEHVTGVDVSPSMLAEAQRNCTAMGLANVALCPSQDGLGSLAGDFDLVHSYIVLQHIPPQRGQALISALARRVAPSGFMALQFPYRRNTGWLVNTLTWLRYRLPMLNAARNLLRGRPAGEPAMQLHAYPLPEMLRTLREAGFGPILLLHDTAVGRDFDSTLLIARRSADKG